LFNRGDLRMLGNISEFAARMLMTQDLRSQIVDERFLDEELVAISGYLESLRFCAGTKKDWEYDLEELKMKLGFVPAKGGQKGSFYIRDLTPEELEELELAKRLCELAKEAIENIQ
jgi:hypothetical protein